MSGRALQFEVVSGSDARKDALDGKMIVFNRPLGIKRDKVVCRRGMRWRD
jgi:hypothetical protein